MSRYPTVSLYVVVRKHFHQNDVPNSLNDTKMYPNHLIAYIDVRAVSCAHTHTDKL